MEYPFITSHELFQSQIILDLFLQKSALCLEAGISSSSDL